MKGEARPPVLVWLLVPFTCHLYGYYWWFTAGAELKDFLEDDDLDPMKDVALAFLTCGLFALFYLPLKYGRLIARAQAKAGMEAPADRGWLFLVTMFAGYYSYGWMQAELNRVWEAVPERLTDGSEAAIVAGADDL